MRATVAIRVKAGVKAGLLVGALAACSSTSSGLPYKPVVQPAGAAVSPPTRS